MLRRICLAAAAGCFLSIAASRASAADRESASLLPPTVVAYAEIADPPQLVETIWDHPLRPDVEKLPQVLEARKQPGFQQFQIMLRFVEFKLGKFWRPAVERAASGGIAVAFDRSSEGVAVLVDSGDPEFLEEARDTLFELVRNEAEKHGQPDPITELEYRGIAAHRIGKARLAIVGNRLIVTNSDKLGRAILDRHLDDNLPSLADSETFQQAARASADEATLWAYVDLGAIREAGVAADLFRGTANDFGGELILGGVLAVLKDAPYAAARFHVDTDQVRLSLEVPHGGTESLAGRDYFFGDEARGAAPAPIEIQGQLASIRTYRNIGELWLRGPDLFEEGVAAQMASAESNLSTLFGGRRFGEEVLGGVKPEIQIVAAAQDYTKTGVPEPTIKIPAFAMVAQLRNPEESQRSLKIAYQTAIGFVNIGAGQQGYPPLELDIEKSDEATVVSATYSPEDDRTAANDEDATDQESRADGAYGPAGRLQYNFSPTVAFAGENLIVASTKELAVELASRVSAAGDGVAPGPLGDADADHVVNTSIRLDAGEIRNVLAANREHLVNQNMIEEGHDRSEAEREIDGLLSILGFVREAAAELVHDDETLQLHITLTRAD